MDVVAWEVLERDEDADLTGEEERADREEDDGVRLRV